MENQEKDELIVETPTPAAEEPASPRVRRTANDFFRELANDNRKLITYILGAVMVIILGVLAFRYFYQRPLEEEAENYIFKAQRVFEGDSMNLALNGNGNDIIGMQDIASDYGLTKTGNLANYYAGRALMEKGQYEEAIDYLKDFSTSSDIVKPLQLGLLGDCYSQMKDYDEAASYYQKAADYSDNEFTTPRYLKKAGLAYEANNEPDKALKAYKRIKEKYKSSIEGGNIEKYLARAETAAGENAE
jgi:tetratricopeptide (TPR) repeat protein